MTEDIFSDETELHLKEGLSTWKQVKEKFMAMSKEELKRDVNCDEYTKMKIEQLIAFQQI